jgi:hypothetical protein
MRNTGAMVEGDDERHGWRGVRRSINAAARVNKGGGGLCKMYKSLREWTIGYWGWSREGPKGGTVFKLNSGNKSSQNIAVLSFERLQNQ